jgi:CheY-like chemotaxis protein
MNPKDLKILYADDDQDDCDLFNEGLIELAPSFKIYYVNHGEKVLKAVQQFHPDVMFLDYNLPGSQDLECLKSIKADPILRYIPVIMYSTSSYPTCLRESFRYGAVRYLLKPVSYQGLFKGLKVIFDLYENDQLTQPDFDKFLIDTYKL